jgi:hypothetical protein
VWYIKWTNIHTSSVNIMVLRHLTLDEAVLT